MPMSDLADAVFGGQLLGHVISGEPLTTAAVVHAATTADLASSMVPDSEHASGIEHAILQSKIAQNVALNGDYNPSEIVNDHLHAQIDASFVNGLLG